MDTQQSDNELATFTSEGHDDFMRRIEESADDNEPAPAAKTPKRRTRRKRPSKQEMAKAVHFTQEKEFLDTIQETDDVQSVRSESAMYPDDPIPYPKQDVWEQQPQLNSGIFSYFADPNQFKFGMYQPNAFTRDFDQESGRESMKSENVKPKSVKEDDSDQKYKRKLIHQIYRYKEKFNLKLKRPPSEKMTVTELEEMKNTLRNQITEKEGARIVKTIYVHGLTGVDHMSQAMGYREMRGLGKVAEAVANDDENELLWEELAIEFEDYLHVSPQRKLIMLTAQILLTTYKINTDHQFAQYMSQQVQQEEDDIRREYQDE